MSQQLSEALRYKKDDTLDTIDTLSKKVKAYVKETDSAKISVEGFYASQVNMNKSFLSGFKAIQTYNNLLDDSSRIKFAEGVKGLNNAFDNQVKSLNGAKASLVGYVRDRAWNTLANIGSSIASGLLSAGISFAVSFVISEITKLIQKNAELRKQRLEEGELARTEVSDLKSLYQQYNAVNNAYKKGTATKEELETQTDSLLEALGVEKSRIKSLTEEYGNLDSAINNLTYDTLKDKLRKLTEGYSAALTELQEKFKDGFFKDFFNDSSIVSFNGTEEMESAKILEEAGYKFEEVGGGQTHVPRMGYDLGELKTVNQITKAYSKLNDMREALIQEYGTEKAAKDPVYIAISNKIEEFGKEYDTVLGFIKDINHTVAQMEYIEFTEDGEIPKTQKEFDALKDSMIKTAKENDKYKDSFVGNEKDIEKAIDNTLANVPEFKNFIDKDYKKIVEERAKKFAEAYGKAVQEQLDKGEITAYGTLSLKDVNTDEEAVGMAVDSVLDKYNKGKGIELDFVPDLSDAEFDTLLNLIQGKIDTNVDWFKYDNDELKKFVKNTTKVQSFDYSSWYDGNKISDLESAMNQLKTAYKTLSEGGKGVDLGADFYNTFPDLEQFANDDKRLLSELGKYADSRIKDLRNHLNVLLKYATDPKVKTSIQSTLSILDRMSDVTTEIEENVENINPTLSDADFEDLRNSLEEYSKGGNVDLLIRPKIDPEALKELGWGIDDGQFATSVQKSFSNDSNTIAMNFTPVITDKAGRVVGVLTEAQLEEYAKGVINGVRQDDLKLKIGSTFSGENALQQAQEYERKINEAQNQYYESLYTNFSYSQYSEEIKNLTSDLSNYGDILSKIYNESITEDDIFSLLDNHPELAPYINDLDALGSKVRDLANTEVASLITRLKSVRDTITDETQKKAIDALIKRFERMGNAITGADVTTLKIEIASLEKLIKVLNDEKEILQDRLDILNETKEAIEKQISNYETSASTVTNYIDKEIQALEDKKSAVEDTYNKEIEALQDEAEERNRINELREKELALEKAKNTKVRVYSAASGWSIQTDKEAVSVAKKEYDDAIRENKIADLETKRDEETKNYDYKIKEYEEYKKVWEEATEAYSNMQSEMTTSATLGSDWRERIMNKDMTMAETFAEAYRNYQTQLVQDIQPQIDSLENLIEQKNKEIESNEKLKTQQEEELEKITKYTSTVVDNLGLQESAYRTLNYEIERYHSLMGMSPDDDTTSGGKKTSNYAGSYANGGTVTRTGVANVHGTKNHPELVLNASQTKKLWDFINSGLMNTTPKLTLGSNSYSKQFDGTPSFDRKLANENKANQRIDNVNNSYTWQISGNDMRINNYAEFKGYMDRFIREAKQDMIVGK